MKKIVSALVFVMLVFTACSTKQGENLNVEDKSKNGTAKDADFIHELALHDAIRAKDIDIVNDLINHGIEIDKKDNYGYTPLHLAVRFGLYDVAELLIKKGANVNNVDIYKDTPLLDSTRNSTNDVSRLLLCNGANSEVNDRHEMKPLHNASKNNDLYIVKMIQNPERKELCQKLDISLDSYFVSENRVCGSIVNGVAQNVNITIVDENSESLKPLIDIDAEIVDNQYCADLTKELNENGSYLVTATGTNQLDKDIETANANSIKVKEVEPSPIISGLYEDLMDEFKEDFEPWNAELDKDGLVFRFKKPEVMFANGSSDVKEEYKKILDKFFPRYMKIIEKYKDEIKDIRVEGHTSSSFARAKNDEERYSMNKVLSENRAKNVYDYIFSSKNDFVVNNKEWLNEVFSYHGMSYDDLILDEMGIEDKVLSRRVEFRINKIMN